MGEFAIFVLYREFDMEGCGPPEYVTTDRDELVTYIRSLPKLPEGISYEVSWWVNGEEADNLPAHWFTNTDDKKRKNKAEAEARLLAGASPPQVSFDMTAMAKASAERADKVDTQLLAGAVIALHDPDDNTYCGINDLCLNPNSFCRDCYTVALAKRVMG